MPKRVSVDKWLFGVTLLLVFIGLIMVFSASAVIAKDRFGSPYTFLSCASSCGRLPGSSRWSLMMNFDYRRLKSASVVFTALGLTTLLLLAVFFLDRHANTHRWIRFGGFSLQPSELAKPAIILFLAYFLEKRHKSITDWRRTLLPLVVPTLIFAVLIVAEPDLGTAMAVCGITAAVLFTAGMEMKYFGYAALASTVPLYFLIFRIAWRARRITAFLNPDADPQGAGFHMIQSLIAVGTGGIFGQGLMEGKQKLFYLPEPQTDFHFRRHRRRVGTDRIGGHRRCCSRFSAIAACARPCCTRDYFARFLAVGITAMVGVQAFFNISVVLGMLPTKGIPLPFISYGGSSLFITLTSVGVLLNITQQTE